MTVRRPTLSRDPSPQPLARLTALLFAVLLAAGSALANPQGGKVVSGNVDIKESLQRLDINQSSSKAIIDWQSF